MRRKLLLAWSSVCAGEKRDVWWELGFPPFKLTGVRALCCTALQCYETTDVGMSVSYSQTDLPWWDSSPNLRGGLPAHPSSNANSLLPIGRLLKDALSVLFVY